MLLSLACASASWAQASHDASSVTTHDAANPAQAAALKMFFQPVSLDQTGTITIQNPAIKSGTVTFDAQHKVLTFNNTKIAYSFPIVESSIDGLTLKLVGKNEIVDDLSDGRNHENSHLFILKNNTTLEGQSQDDQWDIKSMCMAFSVEAPGLTAANSFTIRNCKLNIEADGPIIGTALQQTLTLNLDNVHLYAKHVPAFDSETIYYSCVSLFSHINLKGCYVMQEKDEFEQNIFPSHVPLAIKGHHYDITYPTGQSRELTILTGEAPAVKYAEGITVLGKRIEANRALHGDWLKHGFMLYDEESKLLYMSDLDMEITDSVPFISSEIENFTIEASRGCRIRALGGAAPFELKATSFVTTSNDGVLTVETAKNAPSFSFTPKNKRDYLYFNETTAKFKGGIAAQGAQTLHPRLYFKNSAIQLEGGIDRWSNMQLLDCHFDTPADASIEDVEPANPDGYIMVAANGKEVKNFNILPGKAPEKPKPQPQPEQPKEKALLHFLGQPITQTGYITGDWLKYGTIHYDADKKLLVLDSTIVNADADTLIVSQVPGLRIVAQGKAILKAPHGLYLQANTTLSGYQINVEATAGAGVRAYRAQDATITFDRLMCVIHAQGSPIVADYDGDYTTKLVIDSAYIDARSQSAVHAITGWDNISIVSSYIDYLKKYDILVAIYNAWERYQYIIVDGDYTTPRLRIRQGEDPHIPTGLNTVLAPTANDAAPQYFTLDGRRLSPEEVATFRGLLIVRQGGRSTKVVR